MVVGIQKWPKLVFLQDIGKLLLGPARELIFSLKYLLWNVPIENDPHPGTY